MKQDSFHLKRDVIIAVTLMLLASCVLYPAAFAQTPTPTPTSTPLPGDAYEPDDPGTGDPPWIGNDETQNRSFCPEGDVDRARFYVKAGHWYDVHTYGLGSLVDTWLRVEVGGTAHEDDDGGPEPLASRVRFQAPADGEAIITVANRQAVYGPEQVYKLTAGETAAPTPTPTATARPTREPPPTATPPKPVINFSASPETLEKPGDCATLHWQVDRASEVFLVLPNGNQEGVEGQGERQVCPVETSEYLLKVNAPGGDETVRVVVSVPLPTPTPTPKPKSGGSGGGNPRPAGKATLHLALFVDNDGNGLYDPGEGILGAAITLVSGADPNRLSTQVTNEQGQAHFEGTPAGAYSILIPHLGYAEEVTFRGEELTLGIPVPALRLPSRIP